MKVRMTITGLTVEQVHALLRGALESRTTTYQRGRGGITVGTIALDLADARRVLSALTRMQEVAAEQALAE